MRYYVNEGSSAYSPVVSQCDDEMHWFHSDALGSTVGLTDASGGQTDTFRYEAFGTSLGRTGATETPYQFVGRYGYFKEASAGLEQVWWRWYQPVSGTWVSADSEGNEFTQLYVDGRVTMDLDATGQATWAPSCSYRDRQRIENWEDVHRDQLDKALECLGMAELKDTYWETGGAPTIVCKADWQCRVRYGKHPSEPRRVCGHWSGNRKIVLCRAAFDDPTCGPAACTLLHELTHWAAIQHSVPTHAPHQCDCWPPSCLKHGGGPGATF